MQLKFQNFSGNVSLGENKWWSPVHPPSRWLLYYGNLNNRGDKFAKFCKKYHHAHSKPTICLPSDKIDSNLIKFTMFGKRLSRLKICLTLRNVIYILVWKYFTIDFLYQIYSGHRKSGVGQDGWMAGEGGRGWSEWI